MILFCRLVLTLCIKLRCKYKSFFTKTTTSKLFFIKTLVIFAKNSLVMELTGNIPLDLLKIILVLALVFAFSLWDAQNN